MNNTYLLAMDLSLNESGFVVLYKEEATNIIKVVYTSTVNNKRIKSERIGDKLHAIAKEFIYITTTYNIDEAVREKGFTQHALATQQLYKVYGVIDYANLVCLKQSFMTEYAPTTIKKTIAGSGRASKEEVAKKLTDLCIIENVNVDNDNITDAIAVGLTHILKGGM